jgi:hypothetical protein
MANISKTGMLCAASLGIALVAGLAPTAFNAVVDPFEFNQAVDLDLDKQKISEKAHYPLWKFAHYPAAGAGTVILGDSRARALRDKYWHELGLTDAYNFAYGGATIPEIYDTFRWVKQDPALKTLVVGIQLRSFDPDHKGGMNRVPEALALSESPIDYYSSWFVANVGWRNIAARYPETLKKFAAVIPRVASSASASSYENPGRTPLARLLGPDACYTCRLPEMEGQVALPVPTKGPNLGLGRGTDVWAESWPTVSVDRVLPARFESQVRKNGRSDWKSFEFSEDLWSRLQEIATWSDDNDVSLVFVIPPTISEMQARMFEFGHAELNHRLRMRLAELAPVVDFDFDNAFTRDLSRFSDAYHFNAKAARNIVGEIAQLIPSHDETRATARKRRGDISCPANFKDTRKTFTDGVVEMSEGNGCRVWSWSND